MDAASRAVARRRVFYIPGYDPFPPRRYRELYRREAAEQARLSGYQISVAGGPSGESWRVAAEFDARPTESEVTVLVWSDLVQASMGSGILSTYVQLVRTAWIYVSSGAIFRLVRLRKGPAIAALYPIAALLLQLALGIAVGFMAATLVLRLAPANVAVLLSALIFLGVVWGALWLFRRIDRRVFAWYLMHDYAHSAQAGGAYPDDLRARLAEFSDRVAGSLAQPWDEVLVIGHSSGAHMAISVLADVVRQGRAGRDGPALALLTLGQVVPMVSFLPRATGLRADLGYLSARSELTWVDVTAPGDGCAFALCDPVSVSGVAPADKRWPLVLSAAFTQTLSPRRWRALRWRFFRLHFQYLCAFDNLSGGPGDYDYFAITAGPRTLAARFSGRPASGSRIEQVHSPHRDTGEAA